MSTASQSSPQSPALPPVPPVALVTGAARRLGREIALALARAGFDVGVHYASSADAAQATVRDIQALGRRAVALPAQLDHEAETAALMPALEAALGPVGVLVNSASRFVHDDAAGFSYASFTDHALPNLAAPVLLAQRLHARLPAGHEGVVVNLLDQKLWAPNPDFLSYSLAKAGLRYATTLLAQALAPQVRVVGVAPGLTLPSYLQDAERFARDHRRTAPLGRASSAADIAASVLFAITNRSLTGSTVLCDGGQHLWPLPRDVSLMPNEGA